MDLICRNATTFTATGALDETGFRAFLQRFVDNGLGVYLASGGSGEGHALTDDECRRVYEIGVEVCRGKVPVCANPPEKHTAAWTVDQMKIAFDAGVDNVNLYGPTSLHGYKPTDRELNTYFDDVLGAVKGKVAIAPNPVMGYLPSAALMASVADRHPHVIGVNLAGTTDAYFTELMHKLKRKDLAVYVPISASLHTLNMGAAGLLGAEANILPKTHRLYIDAVKRKDAVAAGIPYGDILRFNQYTRKWHSASPRWLKMAMRVLKLPGGAGIPRKPYVMPGDDELRSFKDGLAALAIPELDELLRAAA